EGLATIDLGGRVLEIIPAPGHQDEAIVVYDTRTGWLLTGDNLYPGRLYVQNWNEYRASTTRMVEFSKSRRVSAVLGTHIEMSDAGKIFPVGSTYQPHETSLVLTPDDLSQLNSALLQAGDSPKEIALAKFVVVPISTFQRVHGALLKWLGLR